MMQASIPMPTERMMPAIPTTSSVRSNAAARPVIRNSKQRQRAEAGYQETSCDACSSASATRTSSPSANHIASNPIS